MLGKFKIEFPFDLLEPCSSKHKWVEGTDDYFKYHHYPDCMCNGSGQQPTGLGYNVIEFIKWLIEHAPHRLYSYSPYRVPSTLKTVVDYVSQETERNHKRGNEIRDFIRNVT